MVLVQVLVHCWAVRKQEPAGLGCCPFFFGLGGRAGSEPRFSDLPMLPPRAFFSVYGYWIIWIWIWFSVSGYRSYTWPYAAPPRFCHRRSPGASGRLVFLMFLHGASGSAFYLSVPGDKGSPRRTKSRSWLGRVGGWTERLDTQHTVPPVGPWCRRNLIPRRPNLD